MPRDTATHRTGEAPQALAAAEAEAVTAKDGAALVRIGLAYSALGQHDKAIALIEQGIARGGLKRPHDAKLHLGIALVRIGLAYSALGQHDKGIRTLEIPEGQMPRRALALVLEWAQEHRAELFEDWELCSRNQPPKKDPSLGITPPLIPQMPWRVAQTEVLPGFRLRVRFIDGKPKARWT
ncbi:MAG: tetratricopeptide repeat protein [Burkholderiaceae bacterium]